MATSLDDPRTAAAPERGHTGVSLKAVALPTEHGGWGMLAEPLVLGLLLAPSLAGAGIALAVAGAFLCRHPLKLVLADHRKRVRHPRTALAERCVAGFGLATLLGLALAVWRAGPRPLLPLAVAAPLALAQLAHDARLQGRRLLPELSGGVALGSSVAALLLAGGWPRATALAAWALLAVKTVSSVLYVRTRFRLDRGQRPALWPAWASHVVSAAAAGGLAILGWAPWLAVLALAILLARAVYGLSPLHRHARPQAVGVQEMAFGFLTIVLLAVGYAGSF